MNKLVKKLLYIAIFLGLMSFPALATDRYVCDTINDCNANGGSGWSGTPADSGTCTTKASPCNTLKYAYTQMSANDTLIVGPGTYTGGSNETRDGGGQTEMPPSGTGGNYTEIKAEVNGTVEIDGEGVNRPMYVNNGTHQYLIFRGLKFFDPGYSGAVYWGPDVTADHIKFFRVGARSNTSGSFVFGVYGGSHFLFEECYAWGTARYKFLIADQGGGTNKIILRRNVARMDDVSAGGMPISCMASYAAQEVEFQNNICLDGDTAYWSNWSYSGSSFHTRKTGSGYGLAQDIRIRGNISLNITGWDSGSSESDNYLYAGSQLTAYSGAANILEHNIYWDVMQGIRNTDTHSGSGHSMDHMTIVVDAGSPSNTSHGVELVNGSEVYALTNSVLWIPSDASHGVSDTSSNDYNSVYTEGSVGDYSSTSAGANDYTDDNGNEKDPLDGTPGNGTACWDYMVKIKDGSDCDGTASDGGDRGATVLYRYGESGTLWGDTDYNTLTTEKLWPFPYEQQIRKDMRAYDPVGGPSGTRGFAANGVTLTSYILNYLNPANAIGVTGSGDEAETLQADVDNYIYVAPNIKGVSVGGKTKMRTQRPIVSLTPPRRSWGAGRTLRGSV